MKQKLLLAIETSVKNGSVSILEGEKEIGSWLCGEEESMSQSLLTGIKNLLLDVSVKKEDFKFISVSNGPGSLTGIRVGISVALGLAFAWGIRCLGVSLLEALRLCNDKELLLCIVSGGRTQSYCQYFQKEKGSSIKLERNDELLKMIRENPQTVVVLENTLSEVIKGEDFLNEIIVCPQNLAGLVGKRSFQLIGKQKFEVPTPVYLQGNNFKTLIGS